MTLRAVIAGGGTGGHVTPALALGEALRAAGDTVLFAGTGRGLEARLVPEAGFELATLDARPLVGRSPLERLTAVLALLRGARQARRVLRRFAADVVIAVGGYASVPAALAALTLRIPLALVNTDATPGRANRLLARFAGRIFVGFPAAGEALRRGRDDPRVIVSGVPLREALRRAFAGAPPETAPDGDERLRLFVFGGSQGARQINDAVIEALPQLHAGALRVVHQTGEADRERVEAAYRATGFEAEVIAFERDMPSRYRWADLVLCRAGALSVAELALAGRPVLPVPLAHVGGGEQRANARELERAGAARVLDARQLRAEDLAREIAALGSDRERLRAMGKAAASLARPEAAAEIVRACRALVAERSRRGGSR
jgi:UDP-N-acetylglucosamine--N-acetylmuramyl-(pentapeptide) pyrophosphoryl-undecaprenol N-acetylglucosamine transferase